MTDTKVFSKVYLLCDCNNFFVSCEKIFRPDLSKRPVAVLSNNDGVVVSRSYETKALGIAMGSKSTRSLCSPQTSLCILISQTE